MRGFATIIQPIEKKKIQLILIRLFWSDMEYTPFLLYYTLEYLNSFHLIFNFFRFALHESIIEFIFKDEIDITPHVYCYHNVKNFVDVSIFSLIFLHSYDIKMTSELIFILYCKKKISNNILTYLNHIIFF